MYYYHIEHLPKKNKSFKQRIEAVLDLETHVIIPLVSPSSGIGNKLSDKQESSFLNHISGLDITILYLAEGAEGNYNRFIYEVVKRWNEVSNDKLFEPSILILKKDGKQAWIKTLSSDQENEFFEIQKVVYALQSSDVQTAIDNLDLTSEVKSKGKTIDILSLIISSISLLIGAK